jgi:predicted permease
VFTCKPFELQGTPKELIMRGLSYMRGIGRLKPGVTIEQAKANLAAVAQSYRQANAEKADSSWTPQLVTLPEDVTGNLRPAFITLVSAVAVVLLIACSNVANLLLVRFTSRKREIALRVALGASRAGIVRLFVIESTLISVIAGALGTAFALYTLPIIPRIVGQNAALPTPNALNVSVLLFTLAVSVVTGLAMGAYPALQSSKSDLVEGLKEGGRGTSGSVAQQRFRRVLVGSQVCLSIVLLTAAALLMTSFMRLANENAGFRVDNLWGCGIALPPSRYPDKAAYGRFAERLQADLQNSPGVENVAIADGVPLLGGSTSTPYSRADRNTLPLNQRPLGFNHSISPGYLKTFSIPLIAGRDFDEHDRIDSQPVVLISQSTAKRLFPNEDPLGHQMFFGTDNGTGLLTTIVGIVGDIRYVSLDKKDDVEFYRPIQQRIFPFMALVVRSAMSPEALVKMTRSTLGKIDPELPIIQPGLLKENVSDSLGQRRLTTTLLGVFAGVAVLLAIIGIYGAVAYSVAQRTGEIGVRMALGAQARDVLRLVITQGMMPVIVGIVVGIGAALAMGKLLAAQLYQMSAYNPMLLASAAILLGLVALLACLFPARRATLINPIQALRTE